MFTHPLISLLSIISADYIFLFTDIGFREI